MKNQRKMKHIRQKKQEKRFAKWFAASGMAFVLLAIGGLLFWHSNQTPPEPITIYKAVPLSEIKQRQPSTPPETMGSVLHTHHPDGGHAHGSISPEVSTDTPETAPTDDTVLAKTDKTSALELTDADLAALEHEALHAKIERIGKEFESILAEINEKYPEAIEVMSLSHEELHKRYPTQASRDALNERLDQMRDAFKDRAIQLLSELPTEMQLEYIIRIEEQISKNQGAEAANEMTAELLDKLKL